jgi:hypothetical protein
MEKIKEIFRHFCVSEIPFLILFTYLIVFIKQPGELFVLFMVIYMVQFSIYNLILTILFYFFNSTISKKTSLILIGLFSCVLIFLFCKKNYYEGLSIDYYNYHKKYIISFLITHIGQVLLWLCLIINQLSVKFYYIIWANMKKRLKKH